MEAHCRNKIYKFPFFLSIQAIIRKINSGHHTPCLSGKHTSTKAFYFLWTKLRVRAYLSWKVFIYSYFSSPESKTFTEAFYMWIYAPKIVVFWKPFINSRNFFYIFARTNIHIIDYNTHSTCMYDTGVLRTIYAIIQICCFAY